VVLLVLAGIWASVIIVPLVRARAEKTPADSIGTFRRQLSVLEHAGPSLVAPANRLRVPRPALVSPFPPSTRQVPLGFVVPPVVRRRRAQRRRRDIFFALLAGTAGSLLLGLLPGLHVMLFVNLVFDLAFAGYVALLVRMRNAAAERESKLRFLPRQPPRPEEGPPALLVRRSAGS
jgi:hypothetical protein